MTRVLYQGLLRSPASWARVGRGYVRGLLRLGVAVDAVSPRGFLHHPGFPLPAGLREVALDAARDERPGIGLGFLHPPLAARLSGEFRANLCVWESDVVPEGWSGALERHCDLVVVPSRFTRDAFVRAGLPQGKLAVAPYGFDESLLDLEPPPGAARTSRPFTFLAVLAPHWRKGVRELCSAYRRAFSRSDHVLLGIKTAYDPASRRRRRPFEIESWQSLLTAAGLLSPGAPPVEIDTRVLADEGMPAVYAAADVVVAPTWGESFGLAILEGLAASRPVVATGWGGHVELLPPGADRLSYRLEPAGDRLYDVVAGAQAAIPDVEALAGRLRWHFERPEESRLAGMAGRRAVAEMTWDAAAKTLLSALTSASDRRA